MKHENNGDCPQCKFIFDQFPGFHAGLRAWFVEFQTRQPEAHISCAGRGEVQQEALYLRHATRAHFGQSAHNYNAAIDIFEMSKESPGNIYDLTWFKKILAPNLPEWVEWYGNPNASFFELPHVEVKGWRAMGLILINS